MSDGTRAPSNQDAALDWLDVFCAPELRLQVARSIEIGQALLQLVGPWSEAAHDVISGFEAGLRGRGVPDDLFAALERLVGIRELIEVAEDLAAAHGAISVVSDDE